METWKSCYFQRLEQNQIPIFQHSNNPYHMQKKNITIIIEGGLLI